MGVHATPPKQNQQNKTQTRVRSTQAKPRNQFANASAGGPDLPYKKGQLVVWKKEQEKPATQRGVVNRAAVNARAMALINSMSLATRANRQIRAQRDARFNPAYHKAWIAAGIPRGVPKPHPVYRGNDRSHRFAYVDSSSSKYTMTVGAGEKITILAMPWSRTQPFVVLNKTSTEFARSWSRQSVMKDQPDVANFVDWSAGQASWVTSSGISLVEDPSHLSGSRYTLTPPSTATFLPAMSQFVGGVLCVSTAGAQNCAYTTHVVCEGDNPTRWGTMCEAVDFDTATSTPLGIGVPDGLRGRVRVPYGSNTNISLEGTAMTYGVSRFHTGANPTANTRTILPLVPEDGWCYHTEIDPSVATPVAQYTSVNNNIRPLNNPMFMASMGFMVIHNTHTTEPISVMIQTRACFSVVLPQGGDGTGTPGLLAIMRQKAPVLDTHTPTPTPGEKHFHTTADKTNAGNPSPPGPGVDFGTDSAHQPNTTLSHEASAPTSLGDAVKSGAEQGAGFLGMQYIAKKAMERARGWVAGTASKLEAVAARNAAAIETDLVAGAEAALPRLLSFL